MKNLLILNFLLFFFTDKGNKIYTNDEYSLKPNHPIEIL